MNEKSFRTISDTVRSSAVLRNLVVWFNRIVTTAVYLVYPLLLAMLFFRRDQLPLEKGLIPTIVIPGVSFILLSIIRDRINAPRPYEVFDFTPVIDKHTSGHSFPSRHIFSIFVIATTLFYFYPAAGVTAGITGAFLAANRVIGGVHFIRDVVVGALSGIAAGIIGFIITASL